jgi:hypothetical protein
MKYALRDGDLPTVCEFIERRNYPPSYECDVINDEIPAEAVATEEKPAHAAMEIQDKVRRQSLSQSSTPARSMREKTVSAAPTKQPSVTVSVTPLIRSAAALDRLAVDRLMQAGCDPDQRTRRLQRQ